MEKNEFIKIRRSLTYQITELKNILSANKKKKDDTTKLDEDSIRQLQTTLDILIQSREKLVQSYNSAKIERINNQARKMAEEILTIEEDEVKLTPKMRGKLTAMANRTYSLEYFSPRAKKTTKKKDKNKLFDKFDK